ncbi:MAG: oligosaccharide flippase family protein [Pseudomonadota bacterium]
MPSILEFLRTMQSRYFERGSFLRNVATLSSGSAAANVILLATSPLLTRLYPPDAFGVFSVFLSVFTIASVFCTLNFHVAIPLPRRDNTAANLVIGSFAVLAVFSAVSVVLLIYPVSVLETLGVLEQIHAYSKWLPLAIFSAGANVVLYYWLLRQKDYSGLAVIKVGQSSTMVGVQVALGLLSSSGFGLIVGHVVSQLAGAIAFAFRSRSKFGKIVRRTTAGRVTNALSRYREFSISYTPGYLISTLTLMLPPVFLSVLFGISSAGLYAFTTRSIRGGLSLIVQSVTRVAYVRSVELANERAYAALLQFYVKLCLRLFLLGLLPFSILLLFGPEIFALAFGEDWRDAGIIAAYMVPGLLAFMVFDHSLHVFLIADRQKLKLIWEGSRFLLMVAAFLIGYLRALDEHQVILLLSIGQALAYGAVFFMCLGIIQRMRSMATSA